jgi:tetratricopeptide (TPR) repeat protein
MEQILALSPDFDATQLKLTAAEGYLLSRIDGATSWRLLREMGGLPADVVDTCLTRWIEEGVLDIVGGTNEAAGGSKPSTTVQDTGSDAKGGGAESTDAASVPPEPLPLPVIEEGLLDDSLDIDLAAQRRILEFEGSLGLPYKDLLDVEQGADAKVVKRAYFKLSKEFHPDRYFRREIGGYSKRLERIFKKVLEAHEMLSDPELCQIENHPEGGVAIQVESAVDASASLAPESVAVEETTAPPRTLTKLERLKQRMPFKIDRAAIANRRAKAGEIFRSACTSQAAGRFKEAESNIRIAISFDPNRTEFKEALGALRLESAGERAAKLLAAPSERMSDGDLREVLTLLEDVLIYRPHDPQLNERAARVCLQLGKFVMAEEYAQTLIERCPEAAGHHVLLGKIYRGQENLDAAMREFQVAQK